MKPLLPIFRSKTVKKGFSRMKRTKHKLYQLLKSSEAHVNGAFAVDTSLCKINQTIAVEENTGYELKAVISVFPGTIISHFLTCNDNLISSGIDHRTFMRGLNGNEKGFLTGFCTKRLKKNEQQKRNWNFSLTSTRKQFQY